MSRDVRELKIIGQLIYPAERVSYEVATQLALASFSNPELRDYLAKNLFDRIPDAAYWALDWIFTDRAQRWDDLLPIAFTTLARKVSKGFAIQSPRWRELLLRELLVTLSDTELPYPTPLQRTALLLLKRWGHADEALRAELLTSDELQSWEQSNSPVQREFAEDLRFELDEYPTH